MEILGGKNFTKGTDKLCQMLQRERVAEEKAESTISNFREGNINVGES